MVEAELVQDGGVQVVHVHLAVHGVVAVFVSATVSKPLLETAAGKAHGEAIGVMVAAGTLVLGVRRAAKFASPPDDGIIQQPALLEVGQQRADRLVGGLSMLHVLGHVGVLIPRGIVAVVGVIYLNVAHPGFAQAPGHQAVTAKVIGRLLVDPVHLQRLGIFISQIENLRRVVLHAPR